MKKNIFLFITIPICIFFSLTQCKAQTDSGLIIRDTIYASKSNYIGYPFSKLVNALQGDITFSYPCGSEKFSTGVVLCNRFIIYVHPKQGFPLWGLELTFSNRTPVDLAQFFTISYSEWSKLMIKALSNQNIASMTKF